MALPLTILLPYRDSGVTLVNAIELKMHTNPLTMDSVGRLLLHRDFGHSQPAGVGSCSYRECYSCWNKAL